ncbi:hypothetical protein DEO72_LG5g1512 [Vigna unguiculata]|uniref:Uncharacterized protein n=1 Tax=Vigna unguiculata TaxID=3917 RepID=A0A4D6LXM0_VIGUN|nr:hypothetical protein DEO72_LG5g1512 [Vigna unguiculata]
MEEWLHTILSQWFPIRKQMEKRRLSAVQDANLDMSAMTNNSLGRTRAGPRWHLCCFCVVEAEDDGRNPRIYEEEEERFLLFFQPWQAATIVQSGSVMWWYDVGVAVRGTTVMERDAASREMGEGETFGALRFAAREIWVWPFLFISPHNLFLFAPNISLVTPRVFSLLFTACTSRIHYL